VGDVGPRKWQKRKLLADLTERAGPGLIPKPRHSWQLEPSATRAWHTPPLWFENLVIDDVHVFSESVVFLLRVLLEPGHLLQNRTDSLADSVHPMAHFLDGFVSELIDVSAEFRKSTEISLTFSGTKNEACSPCSLFNVGAWASWG
jgi:hypothetical protein